jgi:hypothetical protein
LKRALPLPLPSPARSRFAGRLAITTVTVAVTVVATSARAGTPDADVTISTFKTDVQPRIDPVFGGVAALRAAIDEFLALEGDMKKSRDAFSVAVHEAIAQVAPFVPSAPSVTGTPATAPPKTCPPEALTAQRKARDSGRRFLALGRRFEARFREIRRGLSLGDTVGLTPDYRLKASRARELYDELLRDYQEMRAAFHEQLGAELRHVGCKTDLAGPLVVAAPGRNGKIILPAPDADPAAPDPDNLADWALSAPDEPLPPLGATSAARSGKGAPPATPESSPAIWIQIDNTRCARPSAFTLDGRAVAPIPGGKKVQIRTRAGPHSLCVLPATEKRQCGATGTVRRAYLFEGWSMAVRCEK